MKIKTLSWQKVRGILNKKFSIAKSWGSSRIGDGCHWNGTSGIEVRERFLGDSLLSYANSVYGVMVIIPDGINKDDVLKCLNTEIPNLIILENDYNTIMKRTGLCLMLDGYGHEFRSMKEKIKEVQEARD